jgi:lycopene cyclase domain-containing protein
LLGACLLITLPLEFVLGARVYRRPLALVLAVLPVVMIFSIWDLIGIYRQHWSYNVRFVTGIELPPALPLGNLDFSW